MTRFRDYQILQFTDMTVTVMCHVSCNCTVCYYVDIKGCGSLNTFCDISMVILCFIHIILSVHCAWLQSLSSDQLKCDGTRAEIRFCLLAKQTSPFRSVGASVQSTTGSRGVRISGSNAGYSMFRGRVKGSGYPLQSPVSPSLPLPCITLCHHIWTGVYQQMHIHLFIHSYSDLKAGLGRNQSPVMWPAWLWHTASWASSWG